MMLHVAVVSVASLQSVNVDSVQLPMLLPLHLSMLLTLQLPMLLPLHLSMLLTLQLPMLLPLHLSMQLQ